MIFIVARLETEHNTGIPSQPFKLDLVIPPLTKVVIEADTDDAGGNYVVTGVLTGRVYGEK